MEKEYIYPALLSFGYDGGRLWVANFVGLHGCWVEGEDREDVLSRAPSVLGEYLSGCFEAGMPVPCPASSDELRSLDIGEIIEVRALIDAHRDNG